jgi:hypothetical protein
MPSEQDGGERAYSLRITRIVGLVLPPAGISPTMIREDPRYP